MHRTTGRFVRFTLLACCSIAPFAATLRGQPSRAAPPDANRFTRRTLVENMDEPMALDFDRTGGVYWIERRGTIRRLDERTGRVALVGTLAVSYEGETGLGGILLDRRFATTRQLYLYYSSAATGAGHEMRLSRFTLAPNGSLDPRSEIILLRWPYDLASHFGGGMVWDASGNLYLSTGDNSDATPYSPIRWTNAGGRGQDSQRSAGNTMDLRGKILRIHPEPDGHYTIPSGNLFPPGTARTRPEIYTMGNRNPWRLSIDSRTGYLHWGEIGPDAGQDSTGVGPMGYDELNVAKTAGNFGWPFVIGYQRAYNRFDDATHRFAAPFDPARPINASPNNTGLRELPPARPALLAYPYGVSAEYPILSSGGRMADGGPVYRRADFAPDAARPFPAYYDGRWLVVDFVRNWIMALGMDSARTRITSIERLVPDERLSSPIDVKFGPSGDLYLLEYGTQWGQRNADARISRIEYNAGNRAPRAVASADRVAGAVPVRVRLSSAGTVDYDGDALRYGWTVTREGSATPQRFATPNAVVTLAQPGVYIAALTVTDAAGATGSSSVRLVAGNEPPTVALSLTRGNRTFYFPDREIAYRSAVTDREDGAAAARGLRVTAEYVPSGMTPAELTQARDLGPDASLRQARALAVIARSDCRTCHTIDVRSAGPAFRQVARKYAGDAGAPDRLAQKIITGGSGVWGTLSMPAHPALTPAEAGMLARYVLSLGDTSDAPRRLTAVGTFRTAAHTVAHTAAGQPRVAERGAYVLRATYTDRGANGVSPITSSEALLLRHPRLTPESADTTLGTSFTQSRDPGFIIQRSGAFIGFRQIDLTGIGAVAVTAMTRFYTWSHFKGATIAVHLDSPTGPTVGTPLTVGPSRATGMVFQAPPPVVTRLTGASGVHDVYVVFTNPSAGADDALMLVTAVEFQPAEGAHSGTLPSGFTPLFNGRDLAGWHVSRTTHHGTTPDVRAEDGAIVLRQRPYGQGGLLLTNRRYRDFELTLEAKPDWGTNGGIFFRSTEGGSAYQIELVGGGIDGTGNLFGEMQQVASPAQATGLARAWKVDDWNAFRLRVEGDVPRVALWVNGVQMYDVQLTRNDLIADRTDGYIAFQSHWSATSRPVAGSFDLSGSWKPGAAHRFRNVAIRELP